MWHNIDGYQKSFKFLQALPSCYMFGKYFAVICRLPSALLFIGKKPFLIIFHPSSASSLSGAWGKLSKCFSSPSHSRCHRTLWNFIGKLIPLGYLLRPGNVAAISWWLFIHYLQLTTISGARWLFTTCDPVGSIQLSLNKIVRYDKFILFDRYMFFHSKHKYNLTQVS